MKTNKTKIITSGNKSGDIIKTSIPHDAKKKTTETLAAFHRRVATHREVLAG